ncbi:macro domain-containing protein [Deinococcus altitudinis]|uniref:macro domain-containing protein n=1 Tax=Deinococcus altitudinis TaxID=468914 RepID=UPI0038912255
MSRVLQSGAYFCFGAGFFVFLEALTVDRLFPSALPFLKLAPIFSRVCAANAFKADALVNPANSFGFMNGGIDLAYSQRFGWDLQERLRETFRTEHDGELPVGQALIVKNYDAGLPFPVAAPTMQIPGDIRGTPNAYLTFRAALRAVRARNRTSGEQIASVLCPGLGTAIGRLPAETATRQMFAAYAVVVLRMENAPSRLDRRFPSTTGCSEEHLRTSGAWPPNSALISI